MLRTEMLGYNTAANPEIHRGLSADQLYQKASERGRGEFTRDGVMVIETVPTGRSPKAKGVVVNEMARDINFGNVNRPVTEADFEKLYAKALHRLDTAPQYVSELFIRTDTKRVSPVTFISEDESTSVFCHNLFLTPEQALQDGVSVDSRNSFTITHVPTLKADTVIGGERSDVAVVTRFSEDGRHQIVVAGTEYAGENKKSIFGGLQYILPNEGIATMHCSANMSESGETALFFGLSGTGKTTLSTAPNRILIGDDEHGWSDNGVFNFEGGSYAKLINLSEQNEPDIWNAVHRPGSVLENVKLTENGTPIFTKGEENMRGAYPLEFIPFSSKEGTGDHPDTVILLTADGSGVLPAVAQLTKEQALYHFLSGYTSKIPGTEVGITEPTPDFSACFSNPFLAHSPVKYKELLEKRIKKHNPSLWLVNTGWPGGFERGQRISIHDTRRIVNFILDKEFVTADFDIDQLGFSIPTFIEGIASEVLNPLSHWENVADYEVASRKLVDEFNRNFKKFALPATDEIHEGAPVFRASF